MKRKKAFIIIICCFLLSVLLRLPNLNRTISKHHEFNTAVVLINIESWRQAGGGSKFHFIPLLNFQNPGDKMANRKYYAVDTAGNAMYISFGPAWYVIPDFIYQIFSLPVKPIYLQIINLIFNLASVILFFFLLEHLIECNSNSRYLIIVSACILFIFSPCTLWYLGNGYINVGIMMPIVILLLRIVIPLIHSPEKITTRKLFLVALLILILIYFDWFVLVICAIVGMMLLFKIKKQPAYFRLIFTIAISSIAGVLLLFLQFASYAGWNAVTTYWHERFGSRSITNTGSSFPELLRYLIQNFVTAYLPLLIILFGTFIRARSKKIKISFSPPEKLFLTIYSVSVIFYNFILFEWSSEHEYSVLPWSILFSYLAAKFLMAASKKQLGFLLVAFFLMSMSQYYFINRPGKISREGTPYIAYKNFGDSLKQVPKDYKIMLNIKQDPMIEYYAGRNIATLPDYDSAKRYMQHWGISKAVWIEHDNFDFK